MDKCCIRAFLVATFVGADEEVVEGVEQTSTVGQPISLQTSAPGAATTMRPRTVFERMTQENGSKLHGEIEDDADLLVDGNRLLTEKRHLQTVKCWPLMEPAQCFTACIHTFLTGAIYWPFCLFWCMSARDWNAIIGMNFRSR